jgi:signal transduction histidine kinase
LSGVRRVFAESQDYESTLAAIAHLVLPYLGSWCAVDVCQQDGSVRRVAVIHPDPDKQALAQALEKGWPPERDDPLGAPAVMLTRRTVSIPHVSDELLREVARTPDNLQTLLALGIGSVITVPLLARDEILGAITFVSDAAGHQYDSNDVALAEDLAGIAALALDNAHLYLATIARTREDSASQAKAEFFSTMSHEIRTPLNAILGYAELLELGIGGPLTGKQREFLYRLRLSGAHLVELVSDVLDLAKADAGKLTLECERASMGTAVATAIASTEPAAVAANIRVVYAASRRSTDGDGVAFVGDQKRVRQILINVLANAVKFTPEGGTVTLTCGTAEESPVGTHLVGSGPWAYIRVTDTGPGVPRHQREAVFEPFVQSEGGLTRSKGGTGLGLTISRRLARLMGGDLTLETNSPDAASGATFTLWLPTTNEAGPDTFGDFGELASPRIARALENLNEFRVYGLAEIGRHVRGHVEEVLSGVAVRLRSDPQFPSLERLSASEVEDHQLSFLVDVVHALIVIDETGGVDSDLYRHGGEIQRIISALHGITRHHQGWTLEQLERESAIVHEELQALIHRHVPDGMGDATAALAVIEHLVEQSRDASARAYRLAAKGNVSAATFVNQGRPSRN